MHMCSYLMDFGMGLHLLPYSVFARMDKISVDYFICTCFFSSSTLVLEFKELVMQGRGKKCSSLFAIILWIQEK